MSEFKSKCSEANQKLMEDIEKEKLSISLSHNSLQIIKATKEYLEFKVAGTAEGDQKLVQLATIIRELSVKNEILDSVEYVLSSFSAKSADKDGDFFHKVSILIDVFAKKKMYEVVGRLHQIAKQSQFAKLRPMDATTKLRFVLKCWTVSENVIDLLVPKMVWDFDSLREFDFCLLGSN